MKILFSLTLLLSLAALPWAQAAEETAAKPVVPVAKPAAKDKSCPLCKLPGRAALFAGAGKKCPADCAKLCCAGTQAVFAVAGLECDRCATNVRTALAKLKGVQVESVSHETGRAVLKFDPAKVDTARLTAAIAKCGYKVTGQVAAFKIAGLHDDAAAAAVEKVLTATAGVQRIETVCHKSGGAEVIFDPSRTDRSKIAAALNTTRFKVAKDG